MIATGLCASSTDVAFVTPTGSPTSNCTTSQPCTLARALSIDPPRKSIKLADGIYQNAATITLEGVRALSGGGLETTRITNTGTGPIFLLGAGADISFDRLEIFGATNGANPGIGVRCTGGGKLSMSQVRVVQNATTGVESTGCNTTITQAVVSQNGLGLRLTADFGPTYLVDRTRVVDNTNGGIRAEGGGIIRQSIIYTVNNPNLELVAGNTSRPTVEFATLVGNNAVKCSFPDFDVPMALSNVIVQGFIDNPLAGGLNERLCSFSKCLSLFMATQSVGCTNTAGVSLSPDFHLQGDVNNLAIDAASGGQGTIDIDGDVRPKGFGVDIGADEAQ